MLYSKAPATPAASIRTGSPENQLLLTVAVATTRAPSRKNTQPKVM